MGLLTRPLPLFVISALLTALLSVLALAVVAECDSSDPDRVQLPPTATQTQAVEVATTATVEPTLTGDALDAIQIPAVDLPPGEFARYSLYLRRVIRDVDQYWASWLAEQGVSVWEPPAVYTRAEFASDLRCNEQLPDVRGSYFCTPDNYIALAESDQLLPIYVHVGSYGVATVVSHEFGHAVQRALGIEQRRSSFEELQADCFAGAWFRNDEVGQAFAPSNEPVAQAVGAMNTTDEGDDLAERRDAFVLGLNLGPQACLDEFPEDGSRIDFG